MKKNIPFYLAVILALFLSQSMAARIVSVADFGAIRNDGFSDSQAFSAAFTTVVADGGGSVLVPSGEYQFDSMITVDLKSAQVELRGEGTGTSRIVSANTNGIVWFNNTANDNQLIIRNISFVSGLSGAGTALQINNPLLCTNESICSLLMENVLLAPPDWTTNYFNRVIYTSFLQSPRFINVLANGPYGSDAPDLPTESGFRINFGNNLYFENCYSKNKKVGYLLGNISGTVVFDRCNAVDVYTGVVVNCIGAADSSVTNMNFHINARVSGMEIRNADHVSVLYGAPYWDPRDVPYTDITVENCADVKIAGNVFHVNNTNPPRTQIYLKGTTSGVLIKNNIFNAPGTRVKQDSGVSNVTVIENIDNPVHVW